MTRGRALAAALSLILLSGCASAPKPRTIGERIGAGIDGAIGWTSEKIKNVVNR